METTGFVLASAQASAQLAGVIRRHVLAYAALHSRAASTETMVLRLESSVNRIASLVDSTGLAADLFSHSLVDLQSVQEKLSSISHQIQKSRVVRTFLQAPVLARELDEVNLLLTGLEHLFRVIGIIYAQRSEQQQIAVAIISACLSVSSDSEQHQVVFRELESTLNRLISNTRFPRNIQNEAEFNFTMGLAHFQPSTGGIIVHRDNSENIEKATRFFRKACDLGKKEAFRYLGDIYFEGKGSNCCYLTAVDIYKQGVAKNDSGSMFSLASCYEFGHGVEPCSATSIQLYSKAMENGSGEGMYAMGHFKLHGKFVPSNHGGAVRLLRKALGLGVFAAKDSLALCYDKGVVVDRDPEKAFSMLRESFDEGNLCTTADLAKCYDSGNGVVRNPQEASKVYERCIARNTWHGGFYKAFYGLRMVQGIGMPKNEAHGKAIILDATKSGSAIAWYALGECYRLGYGFEVCKKRAKYYYRRAIFSESGIQGIVGAYEALGQMFEEGDGVLLNINIAMRYYLSAAERLSKMAQWKVANAFESGVGQKKDIHRAVYFYRLCANSGHNSAQKKTLFYYMQGHGLERSRVHAKKIMEEAARNGNREARKWLRREQFRDTLIYLRRWSL